MGEMAGVSLGAQVMDLVAGGHGRLAVACSRLDGNDWTGVAAILSLSETKKGGQVTCTPSMIGSLPSGANAVAFLSQGKTPLLAAALDNGDIHLLQTGKLSTSLTLSEHGGPVHGLSCGPTVPSDGSSSASNGSLLASAAADASVILWDIAAPIPHLPAQTLQHPYGTVLLDVAVSDVSFNLIGASSGFSSSAPAGVYLHDRREAKSKVAFHETSLSTLCLDWDASNAQLFRAGLENGQVLSFDLRNMSTPLHCQRRHSAAVRSLSSSMRSAGGTLLASCGEDTRVLCTVEPSATESATPFSGTSVSRDYLHAAEIHQVGDEQFVAVGGFEGRVSIRPVVLDGDAVEGEAGAGTTSAMVE